VLFTEKAWMCRHENGWTGRVEQTDEDWFAATVTSLDGNRKQAGGATSLEGGTANANSLVALLSGHAVCTSRCSGWVEET
jgi:hypothetical protein